MTSVSEVRSTFIDFFTEHDHVAVQSSPLVPHNDPTLLFTNAGMVQFKNVFTGVEKRPYSRATTAQKCVRAGGKHNDLDVVGFTARHLTFFEMLGNFSFGDYFKDHAIELAWDLVTGVFGLPRDRLLITVHSSDEEAASLWRRVAGLADDRIIRIPTSDNFWSMGDTGPCGPCSEIFIDQGPELEGGPPGSADEDGDRFLEFWNLVFMQYEQVSAEERIDLPRPSVDTGMGLERMAAVLQGVKSNFDTDLFTALISACEDCVGVAARKDARPSFNVIADHLRASSFLIADGVLPSNEGRGYVLRRIMRRAMRHVHFLGGRDPVMHRLVPVLVAEMGQAFPELVRAQALIGETLRHEEERFRTMLERGTRLLAEETARLQGGVPLPGSVAFRLYDTFGFPLDLTEDALRREGRTVDRQGFEDAMAEQRAKARKAWEGTGDAADGPFWYALFERCGATEFLGYSTESAEAEVVALVAGNGEVDSAGPGDDIGIVLNQSPFYAESGGQIGDQGRLAGPGVSATITDTQKRIGDIHLHVAHIDEGHLSPGDHVTLTIDEDRRSRLRASHSATHLLHEALRRHLGDHVTQKGSLVAPDRLRFDISHPSALGEDSLRAVEGEVNRMIRMNGGVTTRLMTPDEATRAGALALFGERYGDEVRVVSMGEGGWSTELCGGTHVTRTGDIGVFRIVSESAVASGVRRIEALTGSAALDHLGEQDRRLRRLAHQLKTTPADVEERVLQLVAERRTLEKDVAALRQKVATAGEAGSASPGVREIAGVTVVGRTLDGVPGRELRSMADGIKQQIGSGIVILVATDNGKAAIVTGVTDDLTGRFNAIDLVRAGVEVLGGKGGGGRADMAQGGGPDASRANEALESIEQVIAS
ncbi:MAG: alanine--tRNA ligase [bacterium]|nr:alanine--tRNA ligase [bacterium]